MVRQQVRRELRAAAYSFGHFDHDAIERPNGLVVLERLAGRFKLGDIESHGPCRQAPM
jgi:hypothetical protein